MPDISAEQKKADDSRRGNEQMSYWHIEATMGRYSLVIWIVISRWNLIIEMTDFHSIMVL